MKSLMMTKYGDAGTSLKVQEVPIPNFGKNQILIKTHSASFNPIDYKILRGDFKAMGKIQFPKGIGRDVSGIVEKVGKNVKNFKAGDKIYSRIAEDFVGTMAEYVISNDTDAALIPLNLSFDESASIPLAGLTSYQALVDVAKLSSGESILIHAGSGGVGTIAIQLAKHLGANVTSTTSTKNVKLVKDLGADKVIDYTKHSYLDEGAKFDVVFDTLGGEHTLNAFKVLKDGGRVVSISGALDSITAKQFGLNKFVRLILAFQARKVTKAAAKMNAMYRFLFMSSSGAQLKKIAQLYESGSIKPVIDKTYDFKSSIPALEYLSTGRAKGKVIVKIVE
ncbi:NADP-dependent oxidoreductase [Candidatus Thioglobus sp.]|nr:NADP-dependent oxidoreductase [Candidatus Thioglobus sp.]